jgi:hypothetical protein
MGKRDRFWKQVPWKDGERIEWPDSEAERAALASDLVGAKVIGALEAILEEQLEVVNGIPPKPGRDDFRAEAARREMFANLSETQRVEIRRVMKTACFGTLYWILVKLGNLPGADVDFIVQPITADDELLPKVGLKQTELHHLYLDWVERFSDDGDK